MEAEADSKETPSPAMTSQVFVVVYVSTADCNPDTFVFARLQQAQAKMAEIRREIMASTNFWDDVNQCMSTHTPLVTFKDDTVRRMSPEEALPLADDVYQLEFEDIVVHVDQVNVRRFLTLCTDVTQRMKEGFQPREIALLYSIFRDTCPEDVPQYLNIQHRLVNQ